MFNCLCDFIFNKEPVPTVECCTFHSLIRRVSVGLKSNKATCATRTVTLAGKTGQGENKRFNLYCSNVVIALALAQLLHITGIEQMELKLKE